MKKKFGAFGARQFSLETLVGGRPGTTIFQNPAGGGGLGGVAYKDRARPPPRGAESSSEVLDWPFGTGLSRDPLSQTPPPLRGLERAPPPPRPSQFSPCQGVA